MKRFSYSIIFIVLGSTHAHSQDLIVTTKGDSLNCRIQKIYGNDVHFSIIKDKALADSILTMSQVRYYQINYYTGGYGSSLREINKQGFIPRFRASISGGASYVIRKIPKGLSDWEITYGHL